MKVVITRAGTVFNKDGVNTFIYELSSTMIKKGMEIFVISGYGSDIDNNVLSSIYDIEAVPKIISLKKKPFNNNIEKILMWLICGNILLYKLKPDIIIMNGVVPCWSSGIKIVVNHGLKTQGYYPVSQKLYNFIMYRIGYSIVAVSKKLKQEISNELKIYDITVIPIGLEPKKFIPLPYEQREVAILHIGTRPVKNPLTTIKAFKIVLKKIPKAKLYIVGHISENFYKKYLLNNNLKDNMFLLGIIPRKELRNLYSQVKVVSVPSLYESFSYTILESFASGTPVVGSRTIPCELLINGYNGYRIYSPKDHIQLAEKLIEIIDNHHNWKSLSHNAKKTAFKYNSNNVMKNYLTLYRKLKEH